MAWDSCGSVLFSLLFLFFFPVNIVFLFPPPPRFFLDFAVERGFYVLLPVLLVFWFAFC